MNEGKVEDDTSSLSPAENLPHDCLNTAQRANTDESSDKLTEVCPLGFWVSKVRPIVIWLPQLDQVQEHLESRTETTFSYGNHATFALKVLLYQGIKGIEIRTWATLELVELA